jgi:glycosyltransferase involved in cell wall biosynthesis
MRIAIMGETRLPVLPYGPGGLGRTTHEIATDLLRFGHDVTLFAPAGSVFEGRLLQGTSDDFEAYLDFSHDHAWSFPNTLHLIGDRECPYIPPCAVVQSEYMREFYPTARIAPAGVPVDDIPFCEDHGDYLVFAGANFAHKQPYAAKVVAQRAGKELKMLGPDFTPVDEDEKLEIIGHSLSLLSPYTIDAAPRLPLEAAACGTPTICLSGDGTKAHVLDSLTGFVCEDINEMVKAVGFAGSLKRGKIRQWVEENHNSKITNREIEKLLLAVVGGERW